MQYEKCLNHFVLSVTSILFIAHSTFKKQKLTQNTLETGAFTIQLANKLTF